MEIFHLLIPDGRRECKIWSNTGSAYVWGIAGSDRHFRTTRCCMVSGLRCFHAAFRGFKYCHFLIYWECPATNPECDRPWSNQRFYGAALAAVLVVVVLPFGIRIGRSLDAARFDLAVSAVIAACTVSLMVRAF